MTLNNPNVVPMGRYAATAKSARTGDALAIRHTPELRLPCPDDVKFEVVRRAVERFRQRYEVVDIDGARVKFPEAEGGGWGLVRASNTGPVLVLRFEAPAADRVEALRRYVEGELSAIKRELGVPESGATAGGH